MPESGLGRVVAPVLTPFGVDGQPDASRFTSHALWLLKQGATGLAPFGTTSEANSLSLVERKLLLTSLIASGIDPGQLMPGTGLSSLPETIELTRHAVGLGAAGVLMLPPFYYKAVKDDGLFRFFAEVIEHAGDERLQVYLYHIPPVAQVGFSAELIERLIKAYPNTVVGLKDFVGRLGAYENAHRAVPRLPRLLGLRADAARKTSRRVAPAPSRPVSTSMRASSASSPTRPVRRKPRHSRRRSRASGRPCRPIR